MYKRLSFKYKTVGGGGGGAQKNGQMMQYEMIDSRGRQIYKRCSLKYETLVAEKWTEDQVSNTRLLRQKNGQNIMFQIQDSWGRKNG